jgi:hypothetical protein
MTRRRFSSLRSLLPLATLALATLALATPAHAEPRTLPVLSDIVPSLSVLSLPSDLVCGHRTDDPFELRDCVRALTELRETAARFLPVQRLLARGTLRARPFDFERGVYVFALEDLDGDVVPWLYADAELYLTALRPDRRANMLPTVHSGTLSCRQASIPGLSGVDTSAGRVGDRYPTIVLDPWTITSSKLSEQEARDSPLRDAELPVELVVRLEQSTVNLCCGVTTRTLIEGARAPCTYSPWRVVVEEARAEGLSTIGFATEVVPAEASPPLPMPW